MDQKFTISYRELSMPNLLIGTEDIVPVVPPKSLDLEKPLSTLPSKSSDLESYLAFLSVFNEGVYYEPFRVSDFTDDEMEVSEAVGEDSEPHICAPIYTVPSTLPEDAQGQVPIEIITDKLKEVKKLGIGQFWTSHSCYC